MTTSEVIAKFQPLAKNLEKTIAKGNDTIKIKKEISELLKYAESRVIELSKCTARQKKEDAFYSAMLQLLNKELQRRKRAEKASKTKTARNLKSTTAKQKSKIVDSTTNISVGGRSYNYWAGREVKKSTKYSIKGSPVADDVDVNKLIRKYKLKGFEFGNWVNNNDRMDYLIASQSSLAELAKIIGTNNLGLNSFLGIAFGARGKGGKGGGIAHFEPNYFMINLTKVKGFGSLAHEYGHALDYFFGTYIDQNPRYASLVGGRFSTKILSDNTGGKFRLQANKVIEKVMETKSYEKLKNSGCGEYWLRRNEIFARLFEQYIYAKLRTNKVVNTFLTSLKYESGVYLSAADFTKVKPLMDKLIKEMGAYLSK